MDSNCVKITAPPRQPSVPAKNLNFLIRRSFEIVMLMAFFILLLNPLNKIGSPYQTVIETKNENSAQWVFFKDTWLHQADAGDKLAFYRFNSEFQKPIGEVEIVALKDGVYKAKVIPSSFVFPVGNQGSVIFESDNLIKINLGTNHKIQKNQRINLYKDQQRVAYVKITNVSQNESTAEVIQYEPGMETQNLIGLQASIYIYSNGVYLNNNPLIRAFQWFVLIIVFSLWLTTFFPSGKNIWPTTSKKVRQITHKIFINQRSIWLLLFGLPFSYVVGELIWYVACHLFWVYNYYILSVTVPHYPSIGIVPSQVILAVIYYFIFFYKRKNPIYAIWQHLQYQPQKFFGCPKTLRPFLIWGLHLFVFWAFAYTLGNVVTANLRAMINIAWVDFPAQPAVITPLLFGWLEYIFPKFANTKMFWDHMYELIKHMLTTPTKVVDAQSVFSLIRLSLWSLTITTCLALYSYSVVSILWSRKEIRNIDFTFTGWIITAICYGPLLGGVLYQIIPQSSGNVPSYNVDSWMWLTLIFEALLNLLYTLSIFNMGRKFGVLVDKGVVRNGFYSVIRHPSYLLEAMMFIMLSSIALSGPIQWIAISAFLLKYWLRSEREDQFMTSSNPEFSEYKKQIPWKFIPGIY
ncbi:isoprenylcysteine carboxylmethyltransferase family protein [uncultured Cocleimonas sp.]|uniref:methyltransferase family protein n=1 Tax=uncultured Cocleimonas sp. TaxID=1051587 RepID=UPI002631C008|nr:methyltransferase [uncultured Cocleimonas sp.]